MGMRIGGTSSAGMTQGVGASNWQQRQQSVNDLMSSLQSGDLASAQKAFASLPGSSNLTSSDSTSPLAQIGKALQSGDLAGAQQAAQAFQAQRSQGHGHGHHHHQPPTSQPPATGAVQPAPTGTGSLLNLTA